MIFESMGSGTTNVGYDIEFPNDNKIKLVSDGGGSEGVVESTNDVPLNTWVHFYAKINSTGLYIFQNGTKVGQNINAEAKNKGFFRTGSTNYVLGSSAFPMVSNTTFDEVKFYNTELTNAQILDLYNTEVIPELNLGISTILNSPINNLITTNPSITFNASSVVTAGDITNMTLYLWNSTNNITQITNLVSGESSNSTTWTISNTVNNYTWNVLSCGMNVTTLCNWGTNRTYSIQQYILNSESNNDNALTGSLQTFTFNISSRNYPSLPYVVYNGISHLASISNDGTNYIITGNLNVPVVFTNTNYSFYLYVIDSLGVTYNSSLYYQMVKPISLDDCGSYTNLLFNFTQRDEDTQTQLSGTQNSSSNINIGLYDSISNNLIATFNQSYSTSNPKVCLENAIANGTDYVKGVIEYQASNYVHKFYYLSNYSITTSPFNVDLFDLLTSRSQEFLVTYKDSNFNLANNVLVYVTRDYISEGKFKTVEVAKTDNNGNALIHLVLGDILYTLIFTDSNNNVLSVLENYVPFCDNVATGQCFINSNAFYSTTDLSDYSTIGGISLTQSFNQTNRSITSSFISVSGTTIFNQTVIKFDRFGNNTICSSQLTSPSGSVRCDIPVTYGDVQLLVKVYSNGNLISQNVYSFGQSPLAIYGVEGTLFAIFIILTLVMMFITSLIGVVIALIFGLIIAGILGLIVTGSTLGAGAGIMIAIILCGGILIWKISNRGEAR